MRMVVDICDRCGKEDTKEVMPGWEIEKHPLKWLYVSGKLLCDECVDDYKMMLERFLKWRKGGEQDE